MTTRQRRTYWTAAGILLATLAIGLVAAGGGKAATKSTAPPPPEVGVIHVIGEDVSTYRAFVQNLDLRIAAERVLQAREGFRIARADRFPVVV